MPPNNLQESGLKVKLWKGPLGPGRRTLGYPGCGEKRGMDGTSRRSRAHRSFHLQFYAIFISPCPHPPPDQFAHNCSAGLTQDALALVGRKKARCGKLLFLPLISRLSIEPQPCPALLFREPREGRWSPRRKSLSPASLQHPAPFFQFIFMLCASLNRKPTYLLAAAAIVGGLLGNRIRIQGENPSLMSWLSNELD